MNFIYDPANIDQIRRAVDLLTWEKNSKNSQHKRYNSFLLTKMVSPGLITIPYGTVTFHDRDPLWVNKNTKHLILEKDEMHKRYREIPLICPPYISPPGIYAPKICNPINIPNLSHPPYIRPPTTPPPPPPPPPPNHPEI